MRFADVLEIKNGKNQKAVENPNGKYPIYGSGGVMGYADDYICEGQTVVIGRKGSINNPIFVDEPFWNVDTAFGLCADKKVLLPMYLFYFCKRFNFESLNKTVTIPSLTKSDLLKIEISLPSLAKQAEIVEILSKTTSIIELRKHELRCLDDLIKARFVEMFGDIKLNPKGWELHCFEQLSDVITDGEHATPRRATKGIYLLSARNVLNHAIQLDDVDYIDQEEYERISKRVVPQEGDILISCSGSVGRCCSVPAGLKFQMVRSAALVRFKEKISPIFAEYMITSDFVQEQIDASKTASSQANLFQGKIAKLKGFVPPRKLQDEFAAFVAQVDKSKFVVQKALDKAQLLFDSLMQKYFGG